MTGANATLGGAVVTIVHRKRKLSSGVKRIRRGIDCNKSPDRFQLWKERVGDPRFEREKMALRHRNLLKKE